MAFVSWVKEVRVLDGATDLRYRVPLVEAFAARCLASAEKRREKQASLLRSLPRTGQTLSPSPWIGLACIERKGGLKVQRFVAATCDSFLARLRDLLLDSCYCPGRASQVATCACASWPSPARSGRGR